MNNTTICALATKTGGAISIIRVSGDKSIDITDSIFKGKEPLDGAKGYTAHYGNICDGEKIIDEVIVTVYCAPYSYTGEDSTEIAFHGSPYIAEHICSLLIKNGCTQARPGEFTQRAFLNGKMDLSQAEAVADLIASKNEASHRVAMQQMKGGITIKLQQLRSQLLKLTSLLELELDFSEEDVEFADRTQLLDIAENLKREITALSQSFQKGNAIKNGIPVAIIGAPNVGKSTLLNQLLEEDCAIVSDIQGTTRDTIEDTINISGILFRFIDTAGIRKTNDKIEQMGIERAIKAASKAQIIIMLTEPGVPYPDYTPSDTQTVIKITNKTPDFQALRGKGLAELKDKLLSFVDTNNSDDVIITNIRHKEALDKANLALLDTISAINQNLSGDLISEHLRQCLNCLSEVSGEITTTDILKNIFSQFCIGK